MAYTEGPAIDAVSINDENANRTSSGNSGIVESSANAEAIADLRMIALVLSGNVYKNRDSDGNRQQTDNYADDNDPAVGDYMKNNSTIIGHIPYKAVAVKYLTREADTLGLKDSNSENFAYYLNENRLWFLNGYKVQLYKWNYTKNIEGYPKYIIAFAGTEGLLTDDMVNNIGQGIFGDARQYFFAKELGESISYNKDVLFTGHSLGGGLATRAAEQYRNSAIVFNAAAAKRSVKGQTYSENLLADDPFFKPPKNFENIINYYTYHDWLSWKQFTKRIPSMLVRSVCLNPPYRDDITLSINYEIEWQVPRTITKDGIPFIDKEEQKVKNARRESKIAEMKKIIDDFITWVWGDILRIGNNDDDLKSLMEYFHNNTNGKVANIDGKTYMEMFIVVSNTHEYSGLARAQFELRRRLDNMIVYNMKSYVERISIPKWREWAGYDTFLLRDKDFELAQDLCYMIIGQLRGFIEEMYKGGAFVHHYRAALLPALAEYLEQQEQQDQPKN